MLTAKQLHSNHTIHLNLLRAHCKIIRHFVPYWACLPSFCFGCIFPGLEVCTVCFPSLLSRLITVINTYFLMLKKLGVLAFSLTAGCQVTGNPIPSTQHGSRVVEGFSGDLRCTPVLGRLRRTPNSPWFPGSPPAHTQLTLISWVASGAHPTHLDFLGRLRLTANTQLHFQSVMPTLSCTQPAAHAQHTPQPMLFVYCVRC